ncbi:MAG: hypothetical protein ACREJO_07405 [Phycisphaerales bacterium]
MAQRQNKAAAVWPVVGIATIFFATALPAILTDQMQGRAAGDHWQFHLPMIQKFVREWPRLDFENYLSATTPLYHVVLAAVAQAIGASTLVLRLVGSVFTVGLLTVLAWVCSRRGERPGLVLAACMPVAASLYVWPAGVWLLPDNAGWLGVLGILLLALSARQTLGVMVASGAVLALLVLTRQNHVWAAGVVWFAAWIGETFADECDESRVLLPVKHLFAGFGQRVLRTIPAVIATLPAIGLVAVFVALWGGLVVPRYQGMYGGVALETPAFSLSLVAIYSVFFGGWLWPQIAVVLREHAGALMLAVIAALVLAIVPVTAWSPPGRKGGLWEVVHAAPVIWGHTSALILVLAPCGAAALVVLLSRLPVRERWVMLIAWLGFLAAQTASPLPWQRYHEPFLLMWIVLAVCLGSGRVWRWAWAGPVALAIGFATLTYQANIGPARADQDVRYPLTSPNYWGPPTPEPKVYTEEQFLRRR